MKRYDKGKKNPDASAVTSDDIKLLLAISHNSRWSRREAMRLIQSQQVSVNGVIESEPSCLVCLSRDRIKVNGQWIKAQIERTVVFHKPRACITTRRDPHASRTIYDVLPKEMQSLVPVGRLDKNTTGLLILTNDGMLVNAMIHPSFHVQKKYRVTIDKPLHIQHQTILQKGVDIGDYVTAPARVSRVKRNNFDLVIYEGKKRQVRLMLKALGYHVKALERLEHGPLKLGALLPGQSRSLSRQEQIALDVIKKRHQSQPSKR